MTDIEEIKVKRGKHCFVYQNLKVFDAYPVEKDDDSLNVAWGESDLQTATMIQNFLWLEGHAPRVYNVRKVRFMDNFYYAQVTDILDGEHPTPEQANEYYEQTKQILEKYGVKSISDKVSHYDFIHHNRNWFLVDFNTLVLGDDFNEKIKNLYVKKAKYGHIYYHNIPELGLVNAPRQNRKRVKWAAMDIVDWKNKTVYDLGCAGGYFCQYAAKQGAKDVLGVDKKEKGSLDPVFSAYLSAFYNRVWNVKFVNMDLSKSDIGLEPADIVLFLSMNYHVGIPEYLLQIIKPGGLCIFEDNGKNRNAEVKLKKLFSKVTKVGIGKDQGNCQKPIYHCINDTANNQLAN